MLLTRRPREPSAGEKVQVDMKNGLSGSGPIVDDQSITARIQPVLFGDGPRGQEQVTNKLPVGRRHTVYFGYVFPGYDQNVGRCLRIHVLERYGMFVLVKDPGGDSFSDDLAEDAVRIRAHSFPSSAKLL
jgi:hypothetical protein